MQEEQSAAVVLQPLFQHQREMLYALDRQLLLQRHNDILYHIMTKAHPMRSDINRQAQKMRM